VNRKRPLVAMGGCCSLAAVLAACNGGRFAAGFQPSPAPPPLISTDGSNPNALIQGADGNFYGTTQSGGQYDQGVMFKLTPSGVETVVHSFAGGPDDGAVPQGLILGSDGNYYGTTLAGGSSACAGPEAGGNRTQSSCGTVFKITPAGVESLVYSFGGGVDGGAPSPSLVQASNGDLYGAASAGGARGNGVIFQLTLAGVETVLYSFAGGSGDGAQPASLTLGTDGNLYGVTTYGGPSNDGTVFSATLGGVETVLHSFTGGSDGELPAAPLVEGSDGNFYGTTPFGGTSTNPSSRCQHGCGTVFRITTAGVETVLYAFGGGIANGANPDGGLIQVSDGNFYGTTSSGGNAGCTGGCGTAFTITPVGVETVLHFFGATSSDGLAPAVGLIETVDGNFYGITPFGGQFDAGTLYSMTPTGVETVLFSFGGSANP